MKRSVTVCSGPILAVCSVLFSPIISSGQQCSGTSALTCASSTINLGIQVGFPNIFSAADYPVVFLANNGATNAASVNGSMTEIPFYQTSATGFLSFGPANEGLDLHVVPEYVFASTVTSNNIMGQCPQASFYMDLLETEAFNWTMEASDCANGLFRMVLTDNPGDPGDITQGNRASTITYQLRRNGTLVESGQLSSKFVANPPSFVFNGLTAGLHSWNLSAGASTTIGYCPNFFNSPLFLVPNPGDCGTNLSLRAGLQGASVTGSSLMSDALRGAGLVPATEPYSALGYVYTGSSSGASVPSALLSITGDDAIVDWVIVELRNAITPSQITYSRAALIQRDGDVVGTDGDPYLSFPVPSGNYHVALRHRNHLGVMTGVAQSLDLGSRRLDMASPGTAAYGTNARVTTSFGSCLFSGDDTGNGQVKYTGSGNDRDPIILAVGGTTPNNAVSNVYDRRDTNLDGVIKYTGANNDRDIILTNVGSTTPNNTRTQQLS